MLLVFQLTLRVTLTWENVTPNIEFGLFVEMTFESRSSCGKIGPFVGKDETIGPVVRIGPFVGIGLFGGTGPVVSLTNISINSLCPTCVETQKTKILSQL